MNVYIIWRDIGNGPHLVGIYALKTEAMQILKDAQAAKETKLAFIDMKPLIGGTKIYQRKR